MCCDNVGCPIAPLSGLLLRCETGDEGGCAHSLSFGRESVSIIDHVFRCIECELSANAYIRMIVMLNQHLRQLFFD